MGRAEHLNKLLMLSMHTICKRTDSRNYYFVLVITTL